MSKMQSPHVLNRRDFLKTIGIAGASASVAALSGCKPSKNPAYNPAGHHTTEVPVGQMTYRTTPSSGDKVSLLGYGCMRWPMMDDGNGKQVFDQEQINKLVDYAIEHGVNYFDTAPVYCQGQSERITGIALKRHPRESFFIATKMSNHRLAGQGLSSQELFKRSVNMYHNSFKELQVDYIDYYLLHSIGGGTAYGSNTPDGMPVLNERFFDSGVLDFLEKEREAGRIRNLGFSFHGDVKVFDYMLRLHDEGKRRWDFVQIQMNYLDWKHAKATNARNVDAEYLYGELYKRNIPSVIMEPLLGGRLSNVPDHIVAHLKQQDPENSVASWSFRFCGTYPGVLTVLSGMTYMEHLQDNIRSYAPLKTLTEEELDYLDKTADLMAAYPTIPCNQCNYCMPCPYGIDIPGVLTHYNKCVNEGNVPESRQDPNYRKARRAFLVGYDRSVPKLRQAAHCIGCNQCSPDCPQRINIPAQMQRINDYVEKLKQETL